MKKATTFHGINLLSCPSGVGISDMILINSILSKSQMCRDKSNREADCNNSFDHVQCNNYTTNMSLQLSPISPCPENGETHYCSDDEESSISFDRFSSNTNRDLSGSPLVETDDYSRSSHTIEADQDVNNDSNSAGWLSPAACNENSHRCDIKNHESSYSLSCNNAMEVSEFPYLSSPDDTEKTSHRRNKLEPFSNCNREFVVAGSLTLTRRCSRKASLSSNSTSQKIPEEGFVQWLEQNEKHEGYCGRKRPSIMSYAIKESRSIILTYLLQYCLSSIDNKVRTTTTRPRGSVERYNGSTLIVTSKKDIGEWEHHIRNNLQAKYHSYTDTMAKRRRLGAFRVAQFDVVLTTFDVLRAKEVVLPSECSESDDESVTSFEGDRQSRGWYRRRQGFNQQLLKEGMSNLHLINWERVVIDHRLLTNIRCGTARGDAVCALDSSTKLSLLEREEPSADVPGTVLYDVASLLCVPSDDIKHIYYHMDS